MGRILPRQAYATYGGQFPRSRAAAPNDAIVPWGLVGWWTMDVEDTNFVAGTETDRSGNGNTGTLHNLAASTGVQGQIGQALNFNGSSSYIQTPINQTFTALTLCCWVYPIGVQSSYTGVMFSHGAGSNISGLDFRSNSGQIGYTWNNADFANVTGLSPPANQWSFIGVAVTPALATVFMNASSTSFGGANASSTISNLTIGQDTFGGRFFSGYIDDARIYNRALDQGEFLQLYTAGLAGMGYWSGLGLLATAPATSNLAPQRTLVGVGI